MRALLILAIVLCAATGPAPAQRYHREGGYAPKLPPNEAFDRGFFVCRMMYTSVLREAGGIGWQTDYPYSEINFMTRLGELTKTDVELDSTRIPNHYSVRLTDDALFGCPFVIASDIGTAAFTNEEVARLRTYLLKGGFLWVDDFWGTFAWEHWTQELGKVLPPSSFPIVDVPVNDALFETLYVLTKLPQITSIQFWRRSGGTTTSERGPDSAVPHLRAIRDANNRIMVLMTHNTDIGDSWEREGEDYEYFYRFAHDGYALGINALVHVMAH